MKTGVAWWCDPALQHLIPHTTGLRDPRLSCNVPAEKIADGAGNLLFRNASSKDGTVQALYDIDGKPLKQLNPGDKAYDENGKAVLSRSNPGEIVGPAHDVTYEAVAADTLFSFGAIARIQATRASEKAAAADADDQADSAANVAADTYLRTQAADALVRRSKLVTTITASLFNFLKVDVQLNPEQRDSLEILYQNATDFSEALRYTSEGFMNQINHRQGSPRRWSSKRVRPDLVVFTLSLPRRMTKGS